MMKDIPGYEGEYAVTDCGRVWSHKRGKFMVGGLNTGGYPHVILMKDGKQEAKKIHRLVMLTFVGTDTDPDKNQIDHIDGDKTNNRLDNLRWVTQSENMQNKRSTKGYGWNERIRKWRVQICINKKDIHIGYYDAETEARQAYLEAKKIYHPTSPINK